MSINIDKNNFDNINFDTYKQILIYDIFKEIK